MLNSAYTIENADEPMLEFLRCVRNNDTDPQNYKSALMKAVCPAIEGVRHDREKEEFYMTLQMKLDDVRMEALMQGREEGREEDFLTVLRGMYQENLPIPVMSRITKRSEQEVIGGLASIGLTALPQ